MDKAQVVVIGAGPAGYPAAFRAADLGMNVALIDESENPGGVCLYRGCIPSKTLLHAAALLNDAQEADAIGIHFQDPSVDLDGLRAWKDGVIQQLTGGLGLLSKKRGVQYIQGRARFIDAHTLEIEGNAGTTKQTLSFEHAIVASGSRPAPIPGFDQANDRVLDSTTALEIADIPQRLLVIGGGYIALELGSVYAALGSNVTVVEMMPTLLPGADADLVRVLARKLRARFETIHLKTTVRSVEPVENGLSVALKPEKGQTVNEVFGKVLVSVGRTPNSEDLGLENTAARIGPRGFIETDQQCRTAEPSIFAVGDVAGEPMLAHKGTHQGLVAAEVIGGSKRTFEPRVIPAVVFTDPEIAWCGITESEAKAQKMDVSVAKFPWGASGRALTMARPEGLTKLIVDKATERILGVALAGRGAGEMISEGVLAIEMGATAKDLSLTVHPHPTLSETVMEAAEVFLGYSTHVLKPRKS